MISEHPPRAGDLGLAGRTIVITGAASGIGQATALEASRAGMKVIGVDRDPNGLTTTGELIQAEGAGSLAGTIVADLESPEEIRHAVRQFHAAEPDHFFHAAGIIIRRESIDDVGYEEWDQQIAINQRASWFLTRGFCQQLKSRSVPGSAVLVSSVSGTLGLISGSWVYATTKAAVNSMVKGFAKTYGGEGIRVNAIAPGLVETRMVRGDVRDAEVDSLVDSHIPIGRLARPEEISRPSMFLLSDHASYVTGVTLDVDGGWLRR